MSTSHTLHEEVETWLAAVNAKIAAGEYIPGDKILEPKPGLVTAWTYVGRDESNGKNLFISEAAENMTHADAASAAFDECAKIPNNQQWGVILKAPNIRRAFRSLGDYWQAEVGTCDAFTRCVQSGYRGEGMRVNARPVCLALEG